ncbi:MAG: TRAP transporter large permease [Lachnospiraceae bacterium]|nr:TRAP transporter large permease [Lachnospiraceae bacterium]
MNLTLLAALGVIALLILIFLGMNVGISMFLVGAVGYFIATGDMNLALSRFGTVPFTTAQTFSYVVIPLFCLMGEFTLESGMSKGLYDCCAKWFGHFKGGLNLATIVSNAVFGAICGSSSAAVATMGKLSLPETRRYKYDDNFTAATCAAGGTLSWLIPPSTGFIVYGLTAGNLSVGRLFAAGIIPGIILMVSFMIASSIVCAKNPDVAPAGENYSMGEKLKSLIGIIPIVVLFLVVLGGMFSGLFSYTEAAAIGVVVAIAYTAIARKLTWKGFWRRCLSALKSSIMVFQIMIAAGVFGFFLTVTKLPSNLAAFISGLDVPPMVILIAILIMYIIVGMFMDTLSVVILTIPIFVPIITNLGYDLIWFGVIIVLVMVLGTITPPIGINIFIAAGLDKEIRIEKLMRSIVPYCIALVIVTVICIVFPQISMFLPNHMFAIG